MNSIQHVAEAWWGWMGPMLWQASLLIVIVGLIDRLTARWAWPLVRYALWLLVLIKLLIPPMWSMNTSVVSHVGSWVAPRIEWQWGGASPSSETPGLASQPLEADPDGVPETSGAGRPSSTGGAQASAGPRLSWKVYAMGVWLAGMLLFALLLARRIAKLHRWHREQEERQTIPAWFHELMVQTSERLRLDRLPAIVFSEETVTPAVYGVFRPVLLLPAGYTDSLSREEAEHVLLHELAHLKRGDLWLNGLALGLQIVYWFNPLLIWSGKQLRHVREICCDLTIANLLREKTTRYRETLLATARELLTESLEPGMGLLGVFEEPFRLVPRLRWLERDTWTRRGRMRTAAAVLVVVAVLFLLPMGAIRTDAAEAVSNAEASAGRTSGDEPGDVCIRDETRGEAFTLGFRTRSELLEVSELWIGQGRAALVEERWTVILDRNRNTFTVVNPRARTYVESSLPLDLPALSSDELKAKRRNRSLGGSVTVTGESRQILGHQCEGYAAALWEEHDGRRSEPTKIEVWATTDVDFDHTLLEELLDNVRLISNRNDRARKELSKIGGVQMSLRMKRGNIWNRELFSEEVVSISRSTPPEDVYAPPAGYVREEQLTGGDF